ncbi:MAG: MarR family winged helix-turn-helix transcriptional regulator [Lachnospiraceae bacterium]
MEIHETINDILVNLFHEIWELEEKAIITDEFKDLTNNDMHIIEAVGIGEGNNMTTIAKKLNITVGTLTISMANLVRKGYAIRNRSHEDRRVVYITLSEKGIAAFTHHQNYHSNMVDSIVENIEEDEMPVLLKALNGLADFFKKHREQQD